MNELFMNIFLMDMFSIIGCSRVWSKDLDLLMFIKEKSKKILGISWSNDYDLYIYISRKLEKKWWLWAEVKVLNHKMIYMKGGRKIMMFWQSKDLDFLIFVKK